MQIDNYSYDSIYIQTNRKLLINRRLFQKYLLLKKSQTTIEQLFYKHAKEMSYENYKKSIH